MDNEKWSFIDYLLAVVNLFRWYLISPAKVEATPHPPEPELQEVNLQRRLPRPTDVQAFRRSMQVLVDSVPPRQLPVIAVRLFSDCIIEEHVLERASDEATTVESRTASLLLEVYKSVKADPTLLDKAYSTLANRDSEPGMVYSTVYISRVLALSGVLE